MKRLDGNGGRKLLLPLLGVQEVILTLEISSFSRIVECFLTYVIQSYPEIEHIRKDKDGCYNINNS